MKPRQLLQAMAVAAIVVTVLTACERETMAPDRTLAELGPAASASYRR